MRWLDETEQKLRLKKENKEYKFLARFNIVVNYVWVIIFAYMVITINHTALPSEYLNTKYNKLSLDMTCDGVELFYTGKSFSANVFDLKKNVSRMVNSTKETKYSNDKVLGFNDLLNSTEGIDCEDVSFMVMCLAEKYNETCEYYTYVGANIQSHRGVKCFQYGEWYQIF